MQKSEAKHESVELESQFILRVPEVCLGFKKKVKNAQFYNICFRNQLKF